MLVVAGIDDRDAHDTGYGHPERPARIPAALAAIGDAGLTDAVTTLPVREATRQELLRVHGAAYIDALCRFCAAGGGDLDPDTPVVAGSWETALISAGAGLAAVDALRSGAADAAFVATRPPGHHALANRAMGFCLLNNVAIAAAALRAEGERVVIVDWDVHHGNGTQDIFWDEPDVLYFSTHQAPYYPGTGAVTETGGPSAPGATINVPLPAGTRGDAVRRAVDEVLAPAVEALRPGWVLVSAGFDAHRDDPLADLELSAGDFADLTRQVAALAPRPGRTILFLEGGYDLDALRLSVGASLATLAGEDYRPETATSGGPGRDAVAAAAAAQERVTGRRA